MTQLQPLPTPGGSKLTLHPDLSPSAHAWSQHRDGCPQGLVSQHIAPIQRGSRAQVCARFFFMYNSHRGKRFTSLILSHLPPQEGGEHSLCPCAKELTLPSDKHQHTPAARQVSGEAALIIKLFPSHFTMFPNVFKNWAGQNFKLGKKKV